MWEGKKYEAKNGVKAQIRNEGRQKTRKEGKETRERKHREKIERWNDKRMQTTLTEIMIHRDKETKGKCTRLDRDNSNV